MKTSVTTQFRFGAAVILILFCAFMSLFEYFNLKNQAEQEVFNKTEVYLSTASSIRAYVKDELRPKTMMHFKKESFVVEAMSTSFISRHIMNRIKNDFPEFTYKRAALAPRNPVNKADLFEIKMINWFSKNPDAKHWIGTISNNRKKYFARLQPIYVENECLQCHGVPGDAPLDLIKMYGADTSFGYKVGDVVAADTIYIPMDKTNAKIANKAIAIFIIGTAALFLLLGMFFLLFNKTITIQLKDILNRFSSITGERNIFENEESVLDEFDQLKFTFEKTTEKIKDIHEELKASEIKYRRLFKSSPFSVFICDRDAHVTDLNDAAIKLLGFKNYHEVFHIEYFHQIFFDAKDASLLIEKVHNNESFEFETSLVNRSGSKIEAMVTASRIIDEKDEYNGFEAIVRDITESKRLNKYLAQTEKLASIGQLAAGVAHEINNPLGVIHCYSNLIRKNKTSDDQVLSDIGIIQKQTNICKSVIESLLNFARVSQSDMKINNIAHCIDEIFKVIKQQTSKGITVEKYYDETIDDFVFDSNKIKQVLINLFLNATQAMADGGKIKVSTHLQKERVLIKIADTGKGIAKGNVDRIFEPFFTTKDNGTGLGLSVSYGIIQQHKGELSVKSIMGEGTEFTIKLPYTKDRII